MRKPNATNAEKTSMPTIQVDYMQVGHGQTFRVPMPSYRRGDLQTGTTVLLVGDDVVNQLAIVDCWSPDHQVRFRLL